jgi:serine protease Do
MKILAVVAIALTLLGCKELNTLATDEVYYNVKNGVVLISNEISVTEGGMGTGFILSDNQIVTNYHVVEKEGKLSVYANDSQRKYEATIVYKDEISDIAVLRLRDWELFKANENPTILSLGDNDTLDIGDKIIVVGHPWGLAWTVSEGIISSKDRRLGQNPKYLYQLDAKLYEGNSGGPIFNENGQVVCVSNMMVVKEGGSYGFCIPSDLVQKVLYDFNTVGEVRWRVLNVAASLTEDGSSVILSSVEPDGAAGIAGIKEGDKILEIYTPTNHPKGVKISDSNDLITELAQLKNDEEIVKLLIERNGKKMMIDVKTNFRLSKEYTPDQAK